MAAAAEKAAPVTVQIEGERLDVVGASAAVRLCVVAEARE